MLFHLSTLQLTKSIVSGFCKITLLDRSANLVQPLTMKHKKINRTRTFIVKSINHPLKISSAKRTYTGVRHHQLGACPRMAFAQTLRIFRKIMLAILRIWLCLFYENFSILTKILILGQPPRVFFSTIHFRVLEKSSKHILPGQNRFTFHGPIHCQLRVIPNYASFMLGCIIIGGSVKKLRNIG